MASAFTHAVFSLTMGKTFFPQEMPWRFWMAAIMCSILPDIDIFGFFIGVRYGDILGHRGFSHSLFFAFLVSLVAVRFACKDYRPFSAPWRKLWLFFFLLASSHGLLDALTDGGLGVAFFSPFDQTRYFFPWTPLKVSPIGLEIFLSPWGREVFLNEIFLVWVPAILILAAVTGVRRLYSKWSNTLAL